MMKPVYISSACAISPQFSFNPAEFLQPLVSSSDGKLFAAEPDFRQYINPVAIRRMSRLMKMGISSGMRALELAGIAQPDAIITGTGLGSMTDMEHFLKDMIRLNEETLNPTYFIQSTYNSVNGWLAMQTKCTGYNQTYVNRGLSLELSLLDAQLLLEEDEEIHNVLVGAFDEMTPDYFIVKSKVDYWKTNIPESRDVLNHSDTPGTIGGEGTAFFLVTDKPENSVCTIAEVQVDLQPDKEHIETKIRELLQRHSLEVSDIDVLVTGMNGDSQWQPFYDEAVSDFPDSTAVVGFKHLTGEYPTAAGFAFWLATQLFSHSEIPQDVLIKGTSTKSVRNILIINHYILNTVSLSLLKK